MLTTINISLNVPPAYHLEELTQQLTDYGNWLIVTMDKPKEERRLQHHHSQRGLTRHPSQSFLKGLVLPANTSSEQLIDEYIEDKYGI